MKLTLQIDSLALLAPFRISGYVFENAPVLRVELEDGGHRGRGEASGVYYFDDTPEQMLARWNCCVRGSKPASPVPNCSSCCRAAARAMHWTAHCGTWKRAAPASLPGPWPVFRRRVHC